MKVSTLLVATTFAAFLCACIPETLALEDDAFQISLNADNVKASRELLSHRVLHLTFEYNYSAPLNVDDSKVEISYQILQPDCSDPTGIADVNTVDHPIRPATRDMPILLDIQGSGKVQVQHLFYLNAMEQQSKRLWSEKEKNPAQGEIIKFLWSPQDGTKKDIRFCAVASVQYNGVLVTSHVGSFSITSRGEQVLVSVEQHSSIDLDTTNPNAILRRRQPVTTRSLQLQDHGLSNDDPEFKDLGVNASASVLKRQHKSEGRESSKFQMGLMTALIGAWCLL